MSQTVSGLTEAIRNLDLPHVKCRSSQILYIAKEKIGALICKGNTGAAKRGHGFEREN